MRSKTEQTHPISANIHCDHYIAAVAEALNYKYLWRYCPFLVDTGMILASYSIITPFIMIHLPQNRGFWCGYSFALHILSETVIGR